jgi:hypothetical protein
VARDGMIELRRCAVANARRVDGGADGEGGNGVGGGRASESAEGEARWSARNREAGDGAVYL